MRPHAQFFPKPLLSAHLDEDVEAGHYLFLEGHGFKDIKLLIFFLFKLRLHLDGG